MARSRSRRTSRRTSAGVGSRASAVLDSLTGPRRSGSWASAACRPRRRRGPRCGGPSPASRPRSPTGGPRLPDPDPGHRVAAVRQATRLLHPLARPHHPADLDARHANHLRPRCRALGKELERLEPVRSKRGRVAPGEVPRRDDPVESALPCGPTPRRTRTRSPRRRRRRAGTSPRRSPQRIAPSRRAS